MIRLFDHPYASFLDQVSKPTRYTGTEYGVHRKDWNRVEARVCLAFPDVYEIGMSHLGYRILYDILNRDERTLAERCYAPWLDLEQQLVCRSLPLVSLESARPLCDFDVVGFSLQYELAFTNVLMMLKLAGIPLRAEDRAADAPLVLAGGPVATHVEPLAPFLDAVLIGDGEQALLELALNWAEGKRQRLSRAARLERLAQVAGTYVPSLYATDQDPDTGLAFVSGPRSPAVPYPVRRQRLESLEPYPFPTEGPVGGPETVFDRVSVELARGCTEGCRFCQAGIIYRPVRERSPRQVLEAVLGALRHSGQDEVSLAALSTADVSSICPLVEQLARLTAAERVSLSVASLRAYGLPERLLDAIGKVRAAGLTFAPEAGTQRLRNVINKNVTEEQLLQTAERVFARGFDRMKLYFILGLPTETDEDLYGIIETGKQALAVAERLHRRAKVTLSVATHVPKPHTPFQWCSMLSLEEILRRQQLLSSAARPIRGLSLRLHDAQASRLEGVLARGDRRLAHVVQQAFARGARFDAWEDQLRADVWTEAFARHRVDPQRYLAEVPTSAQTPWDHLDVGVLKAFLLREYHRALRGQSSPPCTKAHGQRVHHSNPAAARADERDLICYDCGVGCDLQRIREQRIRDLEQVAAIRGGTSQDCAATPDRRDQPEPERHRPPQPGGDRQRWRIRFGKIGAGALLGHLDLIRELSRVFRRAGVRVGYTRGYHPKPELSLSPALGVGVASLGEYLDIKLIDAPSAGELLMKLNRAASGSLRFFAATQLKPNEPGLGGLLRRAEYVIALDAGALKSRGGRPWLEAQVEAFLRSTSVVVLRRGKRTDRQVDIRPMVHRLGVGTASSEAMARAAGVCGEFELVRAVVSLQAAGSVRPREIVAALVGDPEFSHRAVRVALLADDNSLRDLARPNGQHSCAAGAAGPAGARQPLGTR